MNSYYTLKECVEISTTSQAPESKALCSHHSRHSLRPDTCALDRTVPRGSAVAARSPAATVPGGHTPRTPVRGGKAPSAHPPGKVCAHCGLKGVTLMAIISPTSSKPAVPPLGASKRSAEPHTGQYYSPRAASQIAQTMHRSRLGVTSCFPSQQISEPSNKKRWFFPRVHLGICAERPSPDLERPLTAAPAGQLARAGNGNFVPTSLSQRKSAGFLSPWEAVFHLLLSAVML